MTNQMIMDLAFEKVRSMGKGGKLADIEIVSVAKNYIREDIGINPNECLDVADLIRKVRSMA